MAGGDGLGGWGFRRLVVGGNRFTFFNLISFFFSVLHFQLSISREIFLIKWPCPPSLYILKAVTQFGSFRSRNASAFLIKGL